MFVIKRDGTKQNFDVKKLNLWSEWASENCGVGWTDIVLDASQHFYDGMGSGKIQDILIEECLKHRTSGHTKMAARLMIGKIYKEAYGDFSIPSLVDYYEDAVEQDWWADLGFTKEQLDYLETRIDHTKDFGYSYSSLRQFYDKYAVDVGRKVESPQMMMMGLAMASMGSGNLDDVVAVYELLSDQSINLPTPTLNGLRTPLEGSPSCTVISADDTSDSIIAGHYLATKYTAQRAGIGVEFTTRAPKEPVKGGRVEHGGKYSIYKHLQSGVSVLSQVTRGGSATVTYTVLDPEVEDLLTMKQQRTAESYRLDHLDYSLAVNNAFLKAVAKGEDWYLVSCYFAPKLYDAFYSGDEEYFNREYEKVKNMDSKWIKKVPARDIAIKFVTARAETGRNYITFIDNVNIHTPFKNEIRLSNLC